ncbi:DUF2272 domain-containing protein [Bradyrhizobium betae]
MLVLLLPIILVGTAHSTVAADELNPEQFANLGRQCRATSATSSSATAQTIASFAKEEHRIFRGNKVDHTGRMTYFGHAEGESDQGDTTAGISRREIPWRRVLHYWEALNDNTPANRSVEDALRAWYYPNVLSDAAAPVSRKTMGLQQLLRAVDELDLSALGESAPDLKAALKQSAIRSSISDVAWSAAFISATMRNANLRPATQFAFSPAHVSYIAQAIRQSVRDIGVGSGAGQAFYRACDPENTKPRVGDLLCYHRHVTGTRNPYAPKSGLTLFRSLFNDFAAGRSPIERSHCDVVVEVNQSTKKVVVIGGNVQNSVTEKTLNINQSLALSTTQGITGTDRCESYNPDKQDSDEPNCNLNKQSWFVLLQSRS